jgi:hypothetical protein
MAKVKREGSKSIRQSSPCLTESQWVDVFRLRCRAKRGERLTDEEQTLIITAWRENRKRYSDLDVRVFSETAPFGSSVWRASGSAQ